MIFSLTAIRIAQELVVYIEVCVCVCARAWPLLNPYRLRSTPDDGYLRTSTLISVRSEKAAVSSSLSAIENSQASFHKSFLLSNLLSFHVFMSLFSASVFKMCFCFFYVSLHLVFSFCHFVSTPCMFVFWMCQHIILCFVS